MNNDILLQLLCITFGTIFFLKIGIFVQYKRGTLSKSSTSHLWQKAFSLLNNPFEKKNQDLEELSKLVKGLSENSGEEVED